MLDDLLELRAGDQIPCDGVVRTADRARGRRVAAHRRERPDQQGRRRRRPLGELRGGGLRALPGDAGRRRLVRGQARHRGPPVPAHPLGADGRHQHDPADRHLGAHPRVGPAAVEPAARPRARQRAAVHRGRGRGHGARGPRAADQHRVRGRCGSPSPGARCWCRSCPRSKAWPASTSCASTRPAPSPRARSCSTRSSRLDGKRRRRGGGGARRAGRRREPQRHRGRARRARSRHRSGRAPRRCRSPRRGSGARPRSTGRARG